MNDNTVFLNVIPGKTECQFDMLPLWLCVSLIGMFVICSEGERKSLQGQYIPFTTYSYRINKTCYGDDWRNGFGVL